MRMAMLLILGILTVTASGCVSRGRHDREVASLQGQISQMDMAMRAQETQRAQTPALKGSFTGVTYRTPAGFEIPALDLQKALKNAGYYSGDVDGKIGPDSREAIRSFQCDNGLTADGVCGKQTWNKLKTHLNIAG